MNMGNFYDCITEFIFVEDQPEPADVIFVPGGSYPDAARRAAKLYHQGYAPYILPSGRYSITRGHFVMPEEDVSRLAEPVGKDAETGTVQHVNQERQAAKEQTTEGGCYETEFEYLRAVLRAAGVPDEAILREDRATYTYQNAIFSREVLARSGICARRAILCCQAFHARRCLMYYQEQFPDTQFFVCPVVTKGISRESWMHTVPGIDRVLGEVERCGGQFHAIMREHMGETR